jgi:Mor family transcriptional regulator
MIKEIQKYVDGHSIYVPKKPDSRKNWGENTETLSFLGRRNEQIYSEYLDGCSITLLSEKYYSAEKSIQRIIRQKKKK